MWALSSSVKKPHWIDLEIHIYTHRHTFLFIKVDMTSDIQPQGSVNATYGEPSNEFNTIPYLVRVQHVLFIFINVICNFGMIILMNAHLHFVSFVQIAAKPNSLLGVKAYQESKIVKKLSFSLRFGILFQWPVSIHVETSNATSLTSFISFLLSTMLQNITSLTWIKLGNTNEKEMEAVKGKKKQQFVLVHGMGHGTWCWYKVVALLKQQGHRVVALDLISNGINADALAHEVKSLAVYCSPLLQYLDTLENEKVSINRVFPPWKGLRT